MKRLIIMLSLLGTVLLYAGGTLYADPLLSVMRLYEESEHLCVDFYLKNAVDRDIVTGLRDGIPALLTYKIDVWRQRLNWYDKLVKTVKYSYRMHFDTWDTLYCVSCVHEDKEEETKLSEVAELIHLVCNQKGMRACQIDNMDPDSYYYVTIAAEIQSLSAERVREIESWLGGEERKEAGGGLLGFVMGLFSSNTKRAETRSNVFSLEGLFR
jgi:hypothetical protein